MEGNRSKLKYYWHVYATWWQNVIQWNPVKTVTNGPKKFGHIFFEDLLQYFH